MDARTFPSLAADYLRLRADLLAEYPELADDVQALADTLDGISDAHDAVRSLIRGEREDKAMAAALGTVIGEYAARKSRIEARADRRREAALRLMQAMDERKIVAPEFTVSIRTVPPKADVYDEEALPETLWDYKTVRSLNRDRLKAALAAGDVPGARLTNGAETIAVRS